MTVLDVIINIVITFKHRGITENNENNEHNSAGDTVTNTEVHGVVEFADNAPIVHVDESGEERVDSLFHGHQRADIAEFFTRPVLVKRIDWTYNNTFTDTFNIYDEWRTNTAVAAKLASYQLFRGNFHIEVRVNGMPFHIGRFQAKWIPPYTGTDVATTTTQERRLWLSQKPGTTIPMSPTSNDVFEFVCPFFCPNDYFNITNRVTQDTIGDWVTESLTTLTTANGAIVNAEISIYVFVTEAELILPTIQTASKKSNKKGGDTSLEEKGESLINGMVNKARNKIKDSKVVKEYAPDNLVSNVTSSVASAMGAFKGIPVIGSYAAAGEGILNKASSVFQYFGLSRLSIVSDHVFVKNRPMTSVANTVGSETVQKLTFDPKQNLSIDPMIAGQKDGADHMSIQQIASNWTFLLNIPWTTADVSGTNLFESLVTPNLNAINPTTRTYSSIGFAAHPFQYWRGSIEFMFVFVVSDYHSGRIIISYDPKGNTHATTPSNEQYNQVVDVKEQTTFCTTVSWGQSVAFKEVGSNQLTLYSLIGTIYNEALANGSIRLTVLNPLKGPDQTVDCSILCYVRGGEDFMVAAPKEAGFSTDGSVFATDGIYASRMVENSDVAICPISGEPSTDTNDLLPAVFFGERVDSFRGLIKRYEFHRTVRGLRAPTANNWVNVKLNNMCFPAARISDPLAGTSQSKWNPGISENRCKTCLMTWLRPAYAGWRGGLRWKVNVLDTGDSKLTSLRVARQTNFDFLTFADQLVIGWDSTTGNQDFDYGKSMWTGTAATNVNNQPVIEFELPYYNQYRYSYTTPDNIMPDGVGGLPFPDGSNNMGSSLGYKFFQTSVGQEELPCFEYYVAAADDFSYIMFIGSPVFNRQ